MSKKIAVVEDESELASLIEYNLARGGFETAISLPPGTAGPYVTVQALDAAGAVLSTAAAKKVGG